MAISEMSHPIHFMFGSRVGFSGVGGSNGAISGLIKFKMAAGRHLKKIRINISLEWFNPIQFNEVERESSFAGIWGRE